MPFSQRLQRLVAMAAAILVQWRDPKLSNYPNRQGVTTKHAQSA